MSYTGGRLSPLFSTEGIPELCREIAHRGGERMTEWTRINTPVGHQPFAENYVPGQLRASIQQKLLVVYASERGTVYESGVETDVSYAPYVEDGTGLYGPYRQMYVIRPKNPDGWLRWRDPVTGQPVFAKEVWQKGIHGQHMFAIGAAMTEHEFHVFADRLVAVWARRRERAFETQPRIHIGKVI